MYRIVKSKPVETIEIRELDTIGTGSGIYMAEKDDIQDILTWDGHQYHWTSLYLSNYKMRNKYSTVKEAVASRLFKGMDVYVFQNRGEFRDFLKYRGCRT